MLKSYLLLTIALPLTQAARLFLSNDDGWDDSNVRSLFNLLNTTTAHELILCAPEFGTQQLPRPIAEDREVPEDEWLMSHDESLWSDDDSLWSDDDSSVPKEWNPLNNKERQDQHREYWPWGFNVSDFRLNHIPYPNPTSAIREGVAHLTYHLYQERAEDLLLTWRNPDLFLIGPKIGSSLGNEQRTDEALPAVQRLAMFHFGASIYFAGATGVYVNSTTQPQPVWSKIYAQLAKKITQTIIENGGPHYLPFGTYLHVNFPHVEYMNPRCTDASQFKFILTSNFQDDQKKRSTEWCGKQGFPFETDVVNRDDGCYVAMSLGQPSRHSFRNSPPSFEARRDIIQTLEPIWTCLPET